MEIEHLSKSQIVLLTLFTTFVSSIATGIVTFSLMQQAPPVITQTVNRIVERTVEKSAPVHAALAAVPAKTVVVQERDTIARAVATMSPSIVRIYTSGKEDAKFLALGVVLTPSGIIATDASALGEAGDAVAELPGGAHARVFVDRRDAASGLAFLHATTTSSELTIEWKPVGLAAGKPVLGQSVIALSGRSALRLGVGVVTESDVSGGAAILILGTSIAGASITVGSPLIDETGALIGISTDVSRGASPSAFVSADALLTKKEDKK